MLNAAVLASKVFADHVAQFPEAAAVWRENLATGMARHNPIKEFYAAICEALVISLQSAVVKANLGGTTDPPGTAPPTIFTLPQKRAAAQAFVSAQGWAGPHVTAGLLFITAPLSEIEALVRVSFPNSIVVGTGTAVVSKAANGSLQAALKASLSQQLPLAFFNNGHFPQDDILGGPVNSILAAQLNNYATAYATGLASVTASVPFVGVGGGAPGTEVVVGAFA